MTNSAKQILEQYKKSIHARSACRNEVGTDHYKKVHVKYNLYYKKLCTLLDNKKITGAEIKKYMKF